MKVVIVGAGPVGVLAALYAARRGYQVEIYEMRGDIIKETKDATRQLGKSINITMSDRGFEALKASGDPSLVQDVVDGTIPVYHREVHGIDKLGRLTSTKIKYHAQGKHLNVVSRDGLRDILLHRILGLPNVKIFFNRKLVHADLEAKVAIFADARTRNLDAEQDYMKVEFELLIGADGAHSAVRHQMAKYAQINLSQMWLDTWWCEFLIGQTKDGKPKINPHTLHVWPQNEFMFLALPNPDGTFTCNLFATNAIFQYLKSNVHGNALPEFFMRNFPGVIPELMTARELREQFSRTTPMALHDLRISPVNYQNRCLLIGDAAHTMVPFYGQGLNVGLEDVRILFEDYLKQPCQGGLPDHPPLLTAYSEFRQPNVAIMNELALNNYTEMRVAQKSMFKAARRRVEETLQARFPGAGWRTLYARVAFSSEPFTEIQRKNTRQGLVLQCLALVLTVPVVVGLLKVLWRLYSIAVFFLIESYS